MFKVGEKATRPRESNRGPKETFGLDIKRLKQWSQDRIQQQLSTEAARQEIAVAKVRGFLDAVATIVKLQSWWRMMSARRKLLAVLAERRKIKRKIYRGWKIHWKTEKAFKFHVLGKFFLAWRDELRDDKRLSHLIFKFFSMCIKRMKLTPQAVLAFFNPGEWSTDIDPIELTKIRRLVLIKLFNGWKAETKNLKTVRFKASQKISRMVRRTKGPLWVKESTLVCFHMWYRFIKVKKAFRFNELDPRFTNPHLPQWTKLYKDITISRIKKKRTREIGIKLTTGRAINRWKYLMTVDRSKPVTPLAVALSHYYKVLTTKTLRAWNDYIRERGRMTRFRNKIFYRWKDWAPKSYKLRIFHERIMGLLRLQRVRKSFQFMSNQCLYVIGRRTVKIKELRRNYCNRKVMICAFALMGHNEHVLMVDCWRRLQKYYFACKSWKIYNTQIMYSWYKERLKIIMNAWKHFTKIAKLLRLLAIEPSLLTENEKQIYRRTCDTELPPLRETLPARMIHVVGSTFELAKTSLRPTIPTINTGYTAPKTTNGGSLFSVHGFDAVGDLSRISGNQFYFFCMLVTVAYKSLYNYQNPTPATADVTLILDDQMSVGSLENGSVISGQDAVEMLGLATGTMDNMESKQAEPHAAGSAVALGSEGTISKPAASIPPVDTNMVDPTLATYSKKFDVYGSISQPIIQSQLEQVITNLDLPKILQLASQGSIFYAIQHVLPLLKHLHDQYLPILLFALTQSILFYCDRIVKDDIANIVTQCANPLVAYVISSQFFRWETQQLTTREFTTLTQSVLLQENNVTETYSVLVWRNLLVLNLEHHIKLSVAQCRVLIEGSHSIEEEVNEIMKRKKIEKMIKNHFNICTFLHMVDRLEGKTLEERCKLQIPPVSKKVIIDPKTNLPIEETPQENIDVLISTAIVQESVGSGKQKPGAIATDEDVSSGKNTPSRPSSGSEKFSNSNTNSPATKFIPVSARGIPPKPLPPTEAVQPVKPLYQILREYNLLTGRLAEEARKVRAPLLQRDAKLIYNGCIKQARQDYLALKQYVRQNTSKYQKKLQEKKLQAWLTQQQQDEDIFLLQISKALTGSKLVVPRTDTASVLRKLRGGGSAMAAIEDVDENAPAEEEKASTIPTQPKIPSRESSADKRKGAGSAKSNGPNAKSNLKDAKGKEIVDKKGGKATGRGGRLGKVVEEPPPPPPVETPDPSAPTGPLVLANYSLEALDMQELLSNFSLTEEAELRAEEEYQQRVTVYNHPVMVETYIPYIWNALHTLKRKKQIMTVGVATSGGDIPDIDTDGEEETAGGGGSGSAGGEGEGGLDDTTIGANESAKEDSMTVNTSEKSSIVEDEVSVASESTMTTTMTSGSSKKRKGKKGKRSNLSLATTAARYLQELRNTIRRIMQHFLNVQQQEIVITTMNNAALNTANVPNVGNNTGTLATATNINTTMNTPITYPVILSENPSVGFYILGYYLGQVAINSRYTGPQWSALILHYAPQYWYMKKLKDRFTFELTLLEGILNKYTHRLNDSNEITISSNKEYKEYGYYTSEKMKKFVLIANKEQEQEFLHQQELQKRVKNVQKYQRSIQHMKMTIKDWETKIVNVKRKIDNYQSAVEAAANAAEIAATKAAEHAANGSNGEIHETALVPAPPPEINVGQLLGEINAIFPREIVTTTVTKEITSRPSSPTAAKRKRTPSPKRRAEHAAEVNAITTSTVVYQGLGSLDDLPNLINYHHNKLLQFQDEMKSFHQKLEESHVEIQHANASNDYVRRMLKQLAQDTFKELLEVQHALINIMKGVHIIETSQSTVVNEYNQYQSYYNMLAKFIEETLLVKEQLMLKDAEYKRILELMSRPPSSGSTPSTPYANVATNSNDSVGGHSAASGTTSRSRTNTPDRNGRKNKQRTSLSPVPTKRTSVNFTFPGEAGGEGVGNLFSSGYVDLAKGEVVVSGDSKASDSSVISSSIGSQKLIPPPISLTKSGDSTDNATPMATTNTGSSKFAGLKLRPDISKTQNAQASALVPDPNRKLTLDEEIALLHYNSPEEIAKREAELKIQLELQLQEQMDQELHMKLFDEYWQAYPKIEPPDDDHSTLNSMSEDYIEETASVISEVSSVMTEESVSKKNRSLRMWRSIGDQHWRLKEEKIQKFLQEQFNKVNIEDIQNLHLHSRSSHDPLDDEESYIRMLPQYHPNTGELIVPRDYAKLPPKEVDDSDEEDDDDNSLFGQPTKKKGDIWYQNLLNEFAKKAAAAAEAEEKAANEPKDPLLLEKMLEESHHPHDLKNAPPPPFTIDHIWQSEVQHQPQEVHLSVSIREVDPAEMGMRPTDAPPGSPQKSATTGGPLSSIHPTAMPGSVYDWMHTSLSLSVHTNRAIAGIDLVNAHSISTADTPQARTQGQTQQDMTSPLGQTPISKHTYQLKAASAAVRPDQFALTGHSEYKRLKKSFLGKSLRANQFDMPSFSAAERFGSQIGDDDLAADLDNDHHNSVVGSQISSKPSSQGGKGSGSGRSSVTPDGRPTNRSTIQGNTNRNKNGQVMSPINSPSHQNGSKAHGSPSKHDDHSISSTLSNSSSTMNHQQQVNEYLELIQTPHTTGPTTSKSTAPLGHSSGQSYSTSHLPTQPSQNMSNHLPASQSETKLSTMESNLGNGTTDPKSEGDTGLNAKQRNVRFTESPTRPGTKSRGSVINKSNDSTPNRSSSPNSANQGGRNSARQRASRSPSPNPTDEANTRKSTTVPRSSSRSKSPVARKSVVQTTGKTPSQSSDESTENKNSQSTIKSTREEEIPVRASTFKFSPERKSTIREGRISTREGTPERPQSTTQRSPRRTTPTKQKKYVDPSLDGNYVILAGKDGRWDVLHPPSHYDPYALTFPPSTEAPLPFETPPATSGIIRATSPSPTRQQAAQMAAIIAAQEDGVDYTKIPGYGMVVKGLPAIHQMEQSLSAPDSIVIEDTSNKRLIETIGLFEDEDGNRQPGGSIHTISTGNGSDTSTLIITDEDDEELEQMIQDLQQQQHIEELKAAAIAEDEKAPRRFVFFPPGFKQNTTSYVERLRLHQNSDSILSTHATSSRDDYPSSGSRPSSRPSSRPPSRNHRDTSPRRVHLTNDQQHHHHSENLPMQISQRAIAGSPLPPDEMNAFQAELRKFIKSRGDVSPPRSPGKLHTKDSHAHMITHAMDQTINHYKTIIPNSSSPKYKRIILAEQRLKQLQYEQHVQMRQPGARVNANTWYKTPGSHSPHSSYGTPVMTQPGTPKIRVNVMKIPNSPLNHKVVVGGNNTTPNDFQQHMDGDMISVYSNGSSNSSTTIFQQLGYSPPPTSPSSKRSTRQPPLRITLAKDKRYKRDNLLIKSKPVPGMTIDTMHQLGEGSLIGKDHPDDEDAAEEKKKISKKFQPWQPTRRLQAMEMDPFEKATVALANESLIGTRILLKSSHANDDNIPYDDFANSCASSVQIIQEIAGDSGYVHYYEEDDDEEEDQDDPLPIRPISGFLAPSTSNSVQNSVQNSLGGGGLAISTTTSNDEDDNRSNASMLQWFTAEYPDVAALVPPVVDPDELSHASNYSDIHAPILLFPTGTNGLSYPPPQHHYAPRTTNTSPIPPNVVLEEDTTTSSITDETGKYLLPNNLSNAATASSLLNNSAVRMTGGLGVSLPGSTSIPPLVGGFLSGSSNNNGNGLESVLQIKTPVLHPHTPTSNSGANTGRGAKLSKPTTPKLSHHTAAAAGDTPFFLLGGGQSDESSEYMNIPVPMKVSITHPRRSWSSVPVDDELSCSDAMSITGGGKASAVAAGASSHGDAGKIHHSSASSVAATAASYIPYDEEMEEELDEELRQLLHPSHHPSLSGSASHQKRYYSNATGADEDDEENANKLLHYPKFDMDSIKQFQAFDNNTNNNAKNAAQAHSSSAPASSHTGTKHMSHTTPAPSRQQKTFGVNNNATNTRNPLFHSVKRKKPAHLPPLSIITPDEAQLMSTIPVHSLSLVGTVPVISTNKQRPMGKNRASIGTTPLQLQQSHSTLDFPSYQWNSPFQAPSVHSVSTTSQASSVGSSYYGNIQPSTPIQQVTVTMNSNSMSSLPSEKRKK